MLKNFRKFIFQVLQNPQMSSDEVNIALIKKVTEEIKSLKLQKKKTVSRSIVRRLKKTLKKNNIDYVIINHRIKDENSIINKVVRKIDLFIDIKSTQPIEKLLQGVTVDSIRNNILDIIGIRIILQEVDDCYNVLNLFHKSPTLTVQHKHTVDYIRKPKKNGYQALHLVATDKKSKKCFEVQIMTLEMNQHSEIGKANRSNYEKAKTKSFYRNIALISLIASGGAWYFLTKRKRRSRK